MNGRARRAATRIGRRCRPERELLEGRVAPAVGAFAATGPTPPAEVGSSTSSSQDLPLGLRYAASETLGASDPSYAMAASGAGYALANAENSYTATVDAGGFAVDDGAGSWSLTVSGVGYGGATAPLGSGVATATANRVEYDYGAISQWFVNGPLGLQQGFTLDARPSGAAAGSPLTIDLAVGGGLTATPDPTGTSVTLARADGSSSLVYGGLIAYDATGAAIPARMVATETADGATVSILVDDADAVYPLTVDPYVQQTRVNGSAAKPYQFFGASVAMNTSGTLAAIGAISSPPTTIRGSVYIFTTNGTTWTRTAELTSSDGVNGDEFGNALAMSADGSTLIVGARSLAVSGRAGQGVAYVFRKNSGTGAWSQISKLTSSDGAAGDMFGYSVGVNSDGSIITVGAPQADVGGNADQGAAYVFAAASATTWSQAAKLTAFDGAAGAKYGYSIAVNASASVVAVGAPSADGSRGAVYSYFQSTPVKLTATDGAAGDGLGVSISIDDDGSVLLAGAPYADVSGRVDQGAAYVFTRSWNVWAQSAKLTATDGAAGEALGLSVAIDATGLTAVAGASGASAGAITGAGAAYVFDRGTGGSWSQVARLVASDAAFNGGLGQAVAVNNRTVLAGAPITPPSAVSLTQGAAYFFRNAPVLAVTSSPSNQTAVVGVPVTFSASSSGPDDRTVRWQVSTNGTSWSDINGATQTWYTFTPTAGDSGKRFRAVFSDSNTTATTTSALLTVAKATTVLTVSSSLNPRRLGDALTITVSAAGVVPGVATPTGAVTLTLQRDGSSDAPITVGPTALSGGLASFSIPTQALGTYTVTATYAGDGVFTAATATSSQVVVKGSTTLTAAVPATAAVGSRVTLVATLTAFGGLNDMAGGIVVKDNGEPIGYPQTTTVNGVTTATFTTPPVTAGTHYYQFMFLGNAQILASSTGVYAMAVGASSSSAASVAPSSASPGSGGSAAMGLEPSALTVAANVVAGVPTTLTAAATTITPRFVQWQYRSQVGTEDQYWVDVVDANQDWYTFTPSAAMQGWQYRAVFTDLAGNYESSAVTTLGVTSGMAVQVSTSPNPRRLGDSMTVTAVATSAASGVGPITGGTMTVTIQRDGSQDAPLVYAGTPVNGMAAFDVPATLALGTYTVTASYSNPTFGVATATSSQVVVKGSTTLTAAVPATAAVGSRVTLVATLTAFGGLNDMAGGIVVKDNGEPIGYPQTTTVNGVTTATFTTPPVTAGTHYYQFMFLGNAQILASSTGVYAMAVGASSSAAATVAVAPTAARTNAVATSAATTATSPTVDAVALTDAFINSSTKKTRSSSALAFWRS